MVRGGGKKKKCWTKNMTRSLVFVENGVEVVRLCFLKPTVLSESWNLLGLAILKFTKKKIKGAKKHVNK